MRKIAMGLILTLSCSKVLLANEVNESDLTIKGLKPFVGVMLGTTTQSGLVVSSNNNYSYNYLPFFQSGLWGGFEYNFDKFAIRAYGNFLASLMGSVSGTTSSFSASNMIFSGNFDVIYRPTQMLGVFIGFGLGDTMDGVTNRSNTNTATSTENYFTTMGNFGVQYNINSNSFLELSTIVNIKWQFSTTSSNGTAQPLFSPTTSVSYSMMAKYAYRF